MGTGLHTPPSHIIIHSMNHAPKSDSLPLVRAEWATALEEEVALARFVGRRELARFLGHY